VGDRGRRRHLVEQSEHVKSDQNNHGEHDRHHNGAETAQAVGEEDHGQGAFQWGNSAGWGNSAEGVRLPRYAEAGTGGPHHVGPSGGSARTRHRLCARADHPSAAGDHVDGSASRCLSCPGLDDRGAGFPFCAKAFSPGQPTTPCPRVWYNSSPPPAAPHPAPGSNRAAEVPAPTCIACSRHSRWTILPRRRGRVTYSAASPPQLPISLGELGRTVVCQLGSVNV